MVELYDNLESVKIKITQDIISYIEDANKHVRRFETIPQINSIWSIDKITSYPNVCCGEDLIELSNNKSEWMRLPLNLFNLKNFLIYG